MKNKGRFKKVLSILSIPVVIIFFCIFYLYLNLFDMSYEPKTINQWFSQGEKNITRDQDKLFINIPENVASTELYLLLKDKTKSSHVKISGVRLDGENQRICINVKYYGLPLPIALDFTPQVDANAITFSWDTVTIGDNGLELKGNKAKKLIEKIFSGPLYFELNKYTQTEILMVSGMELDSEGLSVCVEINEYKTTNLLGTIFGNAQSDLLFFMSISSDDIKRDAYNLTIAKSISDEMKIRLFDDYFSDKQFIKEILAICKNDVAADIINSNSILLGDITLTELVDLQKQTLQPILMDAYQKLTNALNNHYFSDRKMYYNMGQPYDLIEYKTVSVNRIVEELDLDIAEDLLYYLTFCYDAPRDTLYLSYKMSDDIYYLIDNEKIQTIHRDDYNEYFAISQRDTGDYDDAELWEMVEAKLKEYFTTESVFIRYINSDGKDIYVIASPDYDFERYWSFAYRLEEDGLTTLMENIADIKYLNQEVPDFNLETVLYTGDVVLYELGEQKYDIIIDDLKDKGLVSNNVKIVYASYGGPYIAVKLSDGSSYIYKVSKGIYLDTVYEESEAIEVWNDIPDIITLDTPKMNGDVI